MIEISIRGEPLISLTVDETRELADDLAEKLTEQESNPYPLARTRIPTWARPAPGETYVLTRTRLPTWA